MNEPKLRSAESLCEQYRVTHHTAAYDDEGIEMTMAELLQDIQQEAITFARYKALTEAAELVRAQFIHSDFAFGHENSEQMMADKILRKLRDTTKEK